MSFSDNQLRSHLEPLLALDEIEHVTLVADRHAPAMPKLESVRPPSWCVRMIGRGPAKLLTCLWIAIRTRPQWVIGFNLLPHGINAWIAARACGAKAMYYMIGGPIEWSGGGWASENRVFGRLRKPSPLLEQLLLGVIKRVDAVATMGHEGKAALVQRGVPADRIWPIPGSVDMGRFRHGVAVDYDVIAVSSLSPRKRVADLLKAVALLAPEMTVRLAIVGGGPLEAALREEARSLGVDDRVAFLGFRGDVAGLYSRARIFAMASSHEGLSIALTEAMASELVPVVTEVGEVRTLVQDGETGFLVRVGDVDAIASVIKNLLADPDRVCEVGRAARERVAAISSILVVASRYRTALGLDLDPGNG